MTKASSVAPSRTPAALPAKTALLIASGDVRSSANVCCWPTQKRLEREAIAAFADLGWTLRRAHPERSPNGEPHGFIASQRQGRDVFAGIPKDAPLVVVESVWQYSQHVLIGLQHHRGPILILANWSGQWPGLVGALNLRGSLTKAGVRHSMLWAEDLADPLVRKRLREWVTKGRIRYDQSHVRGFDPRDVGTTARGLGSRLAAELKARPAIMGVFDEGCMGMFNAIVPDHLLHATGVFKERLSQSALFHAMGLVSSKDAADVHRWLTKKGMRFKTGRRDATDLTSRQILEQCRMYIAAARIAERQGCDAIGIQYQLGLADLVAASDLAEGLLNCSDRPPVKVVEGAAKGKVIRPGKPITHFNEVDECAGLDGIITERVWSALDMPSDNTLHDLRWGDVDRSGTTDEFVWVFEISGAVPPSHLEGGYRGAVSERQPPMYFVRGGGTIKGVSRAGDIVWSRIYVADDALHMDIGRATAIALPADETQRRWNLTTSQWPIMHAVLQGVSRDQMMARHQSNHIQVVYASSARAADEALEVKASMAHAMGIRVWRCGV
ncbi:MAG: fucose isomerase [Phycisphaerae bacterium]|nr:fucose isomerase [Phycisphaerae bacterium]